MTRVGNIQELLCRHGTVTPRLLEAHGIPRRWLSRMCRSGELVRVARGVYADADAEMVTQHHALAVTARRVPKGVVCLLSALRFHEIGTQLPSEVWIAVPTGTRIPPEPTIHGVHYSPASFAAGVAHHVIEGAEVAIFTPAKTIADCFKFRNHLGMEVAIEALRETVATRKATIAEIHDCARVCRVGRVITPFLQAIA